MNQQEHEQLLVNAFIVSKKRDRLRRLLANPKRRRKALNSLYHFGDLDERSIVRVADHTPESIEAMLMDLDAPDGCWVISTNDLLDGREMRLDEALQAIVGYGDGSLISCIPGELGYFEGEDRRERYILYRPSD